MNFQMFYSILDNTVQLYFLRKFCTFKSVGTTTLAIFLWIKISPGSVSVISLGGALESEHPINKYLGFYPYDNFLK